MIKVIENPETGLDHVRYLSAIIAESIKILHHSLIVSFARRFSEAIEKKISGASEA